MARSKKARASGAPTAGVEANVAAPSPFESLPTELLARICDFMRSSNDDQEQLLTLRKTSRRLCRVASSVLNRHVALYELGHVDGFINCFHPTRRSIRRGVEGVKSYSPLTAFLPDDIRTLAVAEQYQVPPNEQTQTDWKRRFAIIRIIESIGTVLPMFVGMHRFEWRLGEYAPAEIITALAKCKSLRTLLMQESFARTGSEYEDEEDNDRRDRFLARRKYPPEIRNLHVKINTSWRAEYQDRWSNFLRQSFSPASLASLRTLVLHAVPQVDLAQSNYWEYGPQRKSSYDVDPLLEHGTFPHLCAFGLRGLRITDGKSLLHFLQRHPTLQALDIRTDQCRKFWHDVAPEALSTAPAILPALQQLSILPDDQLACTRTLLDGIRPITVLAIDMADDGPGMSALQKRLDAHFAHTQRIDRLVLFNVKTLGRPQSFFVKGNASAIATHTPNVSDLTLFGDAEMATDGKVQSLSLSTTFRNFIAGWPNLRKLTLELPTTNTGAEKLQIEARRVANYLAGLREIPLLETVVIHWSNIRHTFDRGRRDATCMATWRRAGEGGQAQDILVSVVDAESKDALGHWPKVWPET
ncbi:hypothetical protein EXIGLDRAFT_768760 [Exidia glandulosa HHB12029]|uniref:F-box domain-containing protein n=1 Tax=Exidia glandulosa HHB12029 TaxID=1314781 RepID=A0A165HYL4_EXIGL|nr:hypothetical protein EXIGLDRAFT_768760 [Exidia glandulosa HHB12029]